MPLECLVNFFLKEKIVEEDSEEYHRILIVKDQIAKGKNEDGSIQHIYEFEEFSWPICVNDLITNIQLNANKEPESIRKCFEYE